MKIILVDDDEVMHGLVENAVKSTDFKLTSYMDGETFISSADLADSSIILMDMMLPDSTGAELCNRLKQDSSTSEIPVIFISGHDDLSVRLSAYEAGADDFLVKPIFGDELRRKLTLIQQSYYARQQICQQVTSASQVAFTAMTSMGEMGTVLDFMRTISKCHTTAEILNTVTEYYQQNDVNGAVQLCSLTEGFTTSTIGDVLPITAKVLEGLRDIGRIFEFKNRLVINYERASLLISDLPLSDPDKCGRIRDNFAIIAEAINTRLESIDSNSYLVLAKEQMLQVTNITNDTAMRFVNEIRSFHKLADALVSHLMIDFEKAFVHLGMREFQEEQLIKLVQDLKDELVIAQQPLVEFEQDFSNVTAQLSEILQFLHTHNFS